MQLKYFMIVLSIFSVIFLYYLSLLSQPEAIQLDDIPNYEEKLVIVEGIVSKHTLTSYGGHIIEIRDKAENYSQAILFVEEETEVEYGDTIKATGKVTQYKGDWEVVVSNKKDITILQKWQNISIPLWQLAQNPTHYVDMNINVSGFIERDYGSYFYLIDLQDEHTLAVYYDSTRFNNITEGNEIRVGGQFIYNMETLRYIIQTNMPNHFITEVS